MKNTPKDTIDVLIPPTLPKVDHGIDIIGDEWDEEDEWASNEINSDALQNKEDWEKQYEVRHDSNHPYCTNWPVNKKKREK